MKGANKMIENEIKGGYTLGRRIAISKGMILSWRNRRNLKKRLFRSTTGLSQRVPTRIEVGNRQLNRKSLERLLHDMTDSMRKLNAIRKILEAE